MIRSPFRSFGVLACLLAACANVNAPSAPPPPPQAPDNIWGTWWPTAQWPKDARAPGPESVLAASREWERVVYPPLQTPWGQADPSFSILEIKSPFPARRCLRFDLVFSGPGALEEQALKDHLTPEPGAIRAEIVSRGKVVRATANGEFLGWAGNSLGTSGDVIIEFDWLPDDLDDYWVRTRIDDRAVWFLLPYGLGCDPKEPILAVAGRSGPPALPEGRGERDEIVPWSHVEIDVGWLDASGRVATDMPEELHDIWKWTGDKTHVSVVLSNPLDGACEVTLYRETHNSLSLTTPRTTAAVGIPGKRVLFSKLNSLQHHTDFLRRSDRFSFYRKSNETRTWGLLRVTVEEAAFDRAIPGSLFLYTHGAPR